MLRRTFLQLIALLIPSLARAEDFPLMFGNITSSPSGTGIISEASVQITDESGNNLIEE